jgi:hypothetical protein
VRESQVLRCVQDDVKGNRFNAKDAKGTPKGARSHARFAVPFATFAVKRLPLTLRG